MSNRSRVAVDFPIIPSLERLVAKEVDVLVFDTRETFGWVCLGFNVL